MLVVSKKQNHTKHSLADKVDHALMNASTIFSSEKKLKNHPKQFLPFIHERDGVGRLIKPQNPEALKKYVSISQKVTKIDDDEDKQSTEAKSINFNFFKKKNIQHIPQASKEKRKQFINKELDHKIKSHSQKSLTLLPVVAKLQQQNKTDLLDYKFKKVPKCTIRKQSHSKYSIPQQKISCTHLQKLKNKSKSLCNLPKICGKNEQLLHYDIMLRIPKKDIKISYDHPQFDQMKKIKRLSMRTIDNFDESHLSYLQKYNDGKMIAAKLRNELDFY